MNSSDPGNGVPPTPKALTEAPELVDTIQREIELDEIPLGNVALKAARLARLPNDFEMQKLLEYEIGGYPSDGEGVFILASKAGRRFEEKDRKTGETNQYVYTFPIVELDMAGVAHWGAMRKSRRYRTGTTRSVMTVAKRSPTMMDMAMGSHMRPPPR